MAFRLTSELRETTTASTGAYAIDTAADQQLIFYSNIDNDANIERIRYYISGGKLYRGTIEPSGNPITYNSANESSSVVQNNVANGSTPLFYYYNDDYNGVTGNPLTQPVNVTDIRFIRLNLRVYNKAGVQNTNYYTINAGATLRNLKTNLGD
jgi:hypothetical protein